MKIITFAFCFILFGCCSVFDDRTISFSPNALPTGVVGMPYYARITISGIPINWIEVEGSDSYEKNGIVISFNIINPTQQYIEIIGVPNSIELIEFNVRGSTPGTQCSGLRFENKFSINISDIGSRKKNDAAFFYKSDGYIESITPSDTKITTSCL